MGYYWTCPHCGANLDPGESCDCRSVETKETGPPERVRPPNHSQNDTTQNTDMSTGKEGKGMKIKRLRLENFQGLRDATFDFDCRSASVYGNNGAGKTTVFNAVTWLLYGRASTDATGFTPKTRGGPDGYLHNLSHSAYGEFVADNGRIVTLKKTFHEVYKKKRGSAQQEFSGHTVDYELNGVPVKEKDYTAAVLAFCGGDREKQEILTRPTYFSEKLHWTRRREILLDVCGDVSDADVIASNPALRELPDFLRIPGTSGELYSIQEYREKVTKEQRKINENLQGIPARIDEATKAMPDTTGFNAESVERAIAELQGTIQDLNAERAAAATGESAESETRKEISNLQVQIAQGRAKHVEAQTSQNSALNLSIQTAQSEAAAHRRAKEDAEADLRREQERRDWLARRREEIRSEYKTIFAERWNPNSEVCPTCNQRLPAERIQQMQSDFNLRRSNRLTETEQRGQREANKTMIAECDKRIADLRDTAAKEEAARADAENRVRELQAQLAPMTAYESTEEYAKLNGRISELRARIAQGAASASGAVAALDEKIRDANAALQAEQKKRSDLEMERQRKERVAELERREKELSAEYDRTVKGLALCDAFTKAKVSMLTERINEKFRYLRFQLFTNLIGGGVEDGCEVLVPNGDGAMVPYQDANNAARINAGLEIIEILSEHWNLTMPVFVDNAEGVQDTKEIRTQLIQLVVPLSWDKLGDMMRGLLIREYGSAEGAKAAYDAENDRLRLEVRPDELSATRAA